MIKTRRSSAKKNFESRRRVFDSQAERGTRERYIYTYVCKEKKKFQLCFQCKLQYVD